MSSQQSSQKRPAAQESDDSTNLSNFSDEMPGRSGKSRGSAVETTPLMLDVPGHFHDPPMFLDTERRLKGGRWKATVEALFSKASA